MHLNMGTSLVTARSKGTAIGGIPTYMLSLCLLLFAGILAVSCSSPGISLWGGRAYLNSEMLQSANPRWTPQWAPDGQSILFTDNVWAADSDRPVNFFYYVELSTMYLAAADGTWIRTLSDFDTRDPKLIDVSPDFSPDGASVVYATTRHGRGHRGDHEGCDLGRVFDLEIVELDRFNRRSLDTKPGRQYWDVSPRWSPDGSTIAFARSSICDTEDFGIYAVNSDGSNVRLLTGFGGYDRWAYYQAGPVWSPTGHALAFVVRAPTADAAPWTPEIQAEKEPWDRREKANYFRDTAQPQRDILYVVNADGTGLRALYATGSWPADAVFGTPAWSPDGSRIAFVTFRSAASTGYDEQFHPIDPRHQALGSPGVRLFTINLEGLDLQEVGNWTLDVSPVFFETNLPFWLEWSKDGTAIMVSGGDFVTDGVTVLSSDGAGQQQRVAANISRAYGSWSPDGSQIAVLEVGHERQDDTVVLSTVNRHGEQPRVLVRERVERRYKNEFLEAENSPDKEPLHRFE